MTSNKHKITAIVPAAGCGQRMNSDIPKQYITIGQRTVLEHTLYKLLDFPLISKIIVVISREDEFFSSLDIAHHPKIEVAFGGETRADSVLSGLQRLDDPDWVLVHDAARPCVSHADILRLIKIVQRENRGGILATRVSDTIKKALVMTSNQAAAIECTYDRSQLWAAATPQMFNVNELQTCLSKALGEGVAITDEASAIEYCGGNPLLVECRKDNIKVTQPEDLALATFYLNQQYGNKSPS